MFAECIREARKTPITELLWASVRVLTELLWAPESEDHEHGSLPEQQDNEWRMLFEKTATVNSHEILQLLWTHRVDGMIA